jgi:ArsR family transcriptional regulator
MTIDRADVVFRALADQTRLRILSLLAHGELCVCDIMAVLRAPQPKVSRHLGCLKRVGLVSDRREGRWRYYSLVKPKNTFKRRLIECVESHVKESVALQQDVRRLDSVKKAVCR